MAVPVGDGGTPSMPLHNGIGFSQPSSYQEDDTPTRKGWPPSLFVMDIAPEYYCNLCEQVLCKPMVSECGCRFCYLCIGLYFSGKADHAVIHCPGCHGILRMQELHVDAFAKKQLQKERIHCENQKYGCQEVFKLETIGEHLQKCRFQTVECENRCGEKMLPNELDRHLASECPKRMIQCDFCNQSFEQKDIEDHTMVCRKTLAPCPNNCNTLGIHPDLINEHIERECPEAEVKCIFEELGCVYVGPRKLLDEHLKNSTDEHYGKLGGEVAKLKTTISNVQVHLDEIRSSPSQGAEGGSPVLTANVDKLSEMMKKVQLTMVQKFDKIGKLEKSLELSAKKTEVHTQASRVDTLANQTTTLANRVQKLEEKAGQGPRGRKGTTQSLEQRVSTLENQISLHAMRLAEHDVRFQVHGTTSYSGFLIWKIKDYARRKRDADSGKTLSLYSQPFFSSRYGFKMCARVYLNGDGIGKDSHMSLFFVIMKGDYDALLTWPFKQKVSLMLLDQETGHRHLSDSFRPDPTSSSFQRPTAEMNIASGCPLFVSQEVLQNSAYLKDDTIFLKIVVETSDLVPL